MNKHVVIVPSLALAGLLFLPLSSFRRETHRDVRLSSETTPTDATSTPAEATAIQQNRLTSPSTPPTPPVRRAQTKAERIERIADDYDQLTLAVLAGLGTPDNRAAGPSPGLLRQLALLEQEKRRDVAAVLGPREFEDLELKESKAGRRVNQLLGDTAATEEQRRAVFRLQREFELQFDQVDDAAPRGYFERELARQRTQEKIRAVLGEELFGSWLAGEGELYTRASALATEHGLSPQIAHGLQRTRDDYRLRVLALHAAPNMPPDQRAAAKRQLAADARAQAAAILGPALAQTQTARAELLNWLPQE